MKGAIRLNQYKILVKPVFVILFSVMVFLVVVRYAQPVLSEHFSDMEDAKHDLSILKGRIDVLDEFSARGVQIEEQIKVAVPEKNPSALKFLKIKEELEISQLTVAAVESRNPADFRGTTKKADVVYDFLTPDIQTAVSFLTKISKTLPLTTIDDVKITNENNIIKVSVRSPVYWAPYPTELPSLTEPLSGLTQNETLLLSELSAYSRPNLSFLDLDTDVVDNPFPRENPFD